MPTPAPAPSPAPVPLPAPADELKRDPVVDAVNSAFEEMDRFVTLPEEDLPSVLVERVPPNGKTLPVSHPASPTKVDRDAIRAEVAAEVQQQLAEKDNLIEALTARLEQAAEQLDRLQRNGATRVARVAAGLPPELIEEHRTAVEDLKQVITRWEDLQAAATWGRLETQIAELRELIAQGMAPAPQEKHHPAAPAKPAPGGSWWEAQKASLLGDAPPPAPTPSAHEPTPSAHVPAYVPTDGPIVVPDGPAPVDLDGITLDEARQAIRDRDRLIVQLRDPLLIAQAAAEFGGELPPSLDALPEPLRERLAKLETEWQAKFRQAELSLSLERARIGREENAVRLQQEQVRKELIKLGRTPEPLREKTPEPPAQDYAARRTWFGFPKVTRPKSGE